MSRSARGAPPAVAIAIALTLLAPDSLAAEATSIPAALTGSPCRTQTPLGTIRSPRTSTRIDAVFAELVRTGAPGAMVAVLRQGKPLHVQGYGLAELAFGSAWTAETRYRLASVTKSFTAAAILELADRGKVDLDAPVSRYLPGLSAAAGRIRVRDLLTMSSGLWQDEGIMDFTGNSVVISQESPARRMSVADMASYAGIQSRLDFPPGTRFRYIDTNFRMLARVIERATGQSYAMALDQLVLAPAGMRDSAPFPTLDSVFPCQVPTYVQSAGYWKDIGVYALAASGDGAMISTMSDMIAWARYMSAPRGEGLSSRYVRQADAENRIARAGSIYRLGVMAFRHRGYTALGHQGATGTAYVFVPDLELAIVIFTNGLDGGLSMSGRNRDLAARIIDAVLESSSDAAESAGAAPPRPVFGLSMAAVPLARSPLSAGAVPTGTYLCARTGEVLQVGRSGDTLRVSLMGESLGTWSHDASNRWLGMDSHLQAFISPAAELPGGGIDVEEVNAGAGCRFAPVAPQPLGADASKTLEGWYYSDAIKTFYRIGFADGRAYLAATNDLRPDARHELVRLAPDLLRAGSSVIKLTRSSSGSVTGFSMSDGRARNVNFGRITT